MLLLNPVYHWHLPHSQLTLTLWFQLGPPGQETAAPPNKILFVQGLPEASNADMLTMLFQQFPGLKEVRMVEARPGIAFVEFDNDMQSSVAMSGLQNFKIADKQMAITFAKQ